MHAWFSFGRNNNQGRRIEWWGVIVNGKPKFVRLDMCSEWARHEASINDIRQLAINEALKN